MLDAGSGVIKFYAVLAKYGRPLSRDRRISAVLGVLANFEVGRVRERFNLKSNGGHTRCARRTTGRSPAQISVSAEGRYPAQIPVSAEGRRTTSTKGAEFIRRRWQYLHQIQTASNNKKACEDGNGRREGAARCEHLDHPKAMD